MFGQNLHFRKKIQFYQLVILFSAVFASFGVDSKTPYPTLTEATSSGYWIIELDQPGLLPKLREQGGQFSSIASDGDQLDLRLTEISRYCESMAARASVWLNREIDADFIYRVSMSGFAAKLTSDEAEKLLKMPGVRAIFPSHEYRPHLDAGPQWIGAPDVWQGPAGLNSEGEGIVIGIIDGGINWDHAFFTDPGGDGFDHINPRGSQFGLCNQANVLCNDKVIGVYDFTTEGSSGRDTGGHGSHVASIAGGNRLAFSLPFPTGPVNFQVAGVAPHANIISYKVCEADSGGGNPGSCLGAAILQAIEQAILDQVDVINISLGTEAPDRFSPWLLPIPRAILNAREAGILTAQSAGNLGPITGTVTSAANSPWLISVGNISHNRIIGQQLTSLTGGGSTPPDTLQGGGDTTGFGPARVVHARDFGFPLCGTGAAESRTGCSAGDPNPLTGSSNPFSPGTFNGEIVVCDRGFYGRIEKGFNVLAAGAGGMVLANTEDSLDSVDSDAHCLPTVHLAQSEADELRTWLTTGVNHRGRISGVTVSRSDDFGNQLAASSSRGPNPEIEGVVKPNIVAPGTGILGASEIAGQVAFLTGTSMSSPHIAGAAALLLGVNPDWTPAQLQSALETTADAGNIRDGGADAGINIRGAGVPILGRAVNVGLSLNFSATDFLAANPQSGGDPRQMNLSLMQDSDCSLNCQFVRRVTDMQGGGSWTVTTEGELPLTVSPSQFTLGNGQSRTLTIEADTSNPALTGRWVDGMVVLQSPGAPAQRLQVTVLASGGDLPEIVDIATANSRDRDNLGLTGLTEIPHGNWDASGLVAAELASFNIVGDPTQDFPFDSPTGTAIQLREVPVGAAMLVAQTNQSTADDIDLFVGLDLNGDGLPAEEEVLCFSVSFDSLERCVINNPQPGNYWIVLQNWQASGVGPDTVDAEFAIIPRQNGGNFFVNGPGVVAAGQPFTLELAWDEGRMQRNVPWWAVVTLGTDENSPGNLGQVPVRIRRTGDDAGDTLPLFNGRLRRLVLAGNSEHQRAFIDVPPAATRLQARLVAGSGQLQAVRVAFADAFSAEPFAAPAPVSRPFSAPVQNGEALLDISGADLAPGRWYLIPRNTSSSEQIMTLQADLTVNSAPFTAERNGYGPLNRDVSQGVEFNRVGNNFGAAFFTYAQDGSPVTYLGAGDVTQASGMVVHGPLNAFVGIPGAQQAMPVGWLGLTFLDERELILSYDLMGHSGSEHLGTIAQLTCPSVNNQQLNVTGHWTPQVAGGGGTALLVNQNNQAFVFYFFDRFGIQRWLLANSPDNFPNNPITNAQQFSGFCPSCVPAPGGQTVVGTIEHRFDSNSAGQQIVDVTLVPPLNGALDFQRSLFKLTDVNQCQ